MLSLLPFFGLLFAQQCRGSVGELISPLPPMGWSSWNAFGPHVSETLILSMAQKLAATGLRDAGYTSCNIDDGWAETRNASGFIVPNATRFPSGMAFLARKVHALGLKIGIYSDAGLLTCDGKPGSWGHEREDAESYAAWDFDYLKYDYCYMYVDAREPYTRMSQALRATGHNFTFSLCDAGMFNVWEWGGEIANLWRTTPDIKPQWEKWTRNLDLQQIYNVAPYAGPGKNQGWNDPDMLEVGNPPMTHTEGVSHFSLWAIMAAPLIIGCDIRHASQSTLDILLNKEVIAVDQDPLGRQGVRVYKGLTEAVEVYARPLASGAVAVVLFNRENVGAAGVRNITATWEQVSVPGGSATVCAVRDLWLHKSLGLHAGHFTAEVQPHGVVMVTLTPRK
jgi:alpha-galactosidase